MHMRIETQGCRFCVTISGGHRHSDVWNVRLVETDNFVVLPSKGSLVPGWAMVIPRKHCLSFSSLATQEVDELTALLDHLDQAIRKTFASPTLFEHGAVCRNSGFGCGIDHAHLHVVPLPFDLLVASRNRLDNPWVRAKAPWLEPAQTPYLTIRRPGDAHWMRASPKAIQSQFFRRVIAEKLGSTEFHYDRVPATENAVATLKALQPRFS